MVVQEFVENEAMRQQLIHQELDEVRFKHSSCQWDAVASHPAAAQSLVPCDRVCSRHPCRIAGTFAPTLDAVAERSELLASTWAMAPGLRCDARERTCPLKCIAMGTLNRGGAPCHACLIQPAQADTVHPPHMIEMSRFSPVPSPAMETGTFGARLSQSLCSR